MERQRVASITSGLPHLHRSLDDPTAQDPHRIITPPEDFQDRQPGLIEPPVQFRPMPTSGRERPKALSGPDELAAVADVAPDERAFNLELERLRTNSVLLRFPLDGCVGHRVVQYRSSRSVVESRYGANCIPGGPPSRMCC